MSQPYVPGPSFWYLSSGANGAFEFLGTCESETTVTLAPEWEEVYTDASGTRVPFDYQFMGARGTVEGNLIKYNEAVFGRAKNFLNNANATPGTFPDGSIGTLARTENRGYSLAIVSAYRTKPVFTSNGMPGGILFPFAIPMGSWSSPLSTRVKRNKVLFECTPLWTPLGGGVLFSHDLSGLALPNIN